MTNEQRKAASAWLSLNAEPGRPLKDSERKKWEERLDKYVKNWQKEGVATLGPLDLAGLTAIQAHVRAQYEQAKVRRNNAGTGVSRQDSLDVQERQNQKNRLVLHALASSLPSPTKPTPPPTSDEDLMPATPYPARKTLYPSLDTEPEGDRPPPYAQPLDPQPRRATPAQRDPGGPTIPSDAFEPPSSPDSRRLMAPLMQIDHATPHTPVLVHWSYPDAHTQDPGETRIPVVKPRGTEPRPTKSSRSPCRMIPGRAGPLGQEPHANCHSSKTPKDERTRSRSISPPGQARPRPPLSDPRPSTERATTGLQFSLTRYRVDNPDALTSIMAELSARTDEARDRENAPGKERPYGTSRAAHEKGASQIYHEESHEEYLALLEELRSGRMDRRRSDDTADTLEWNPAHGTDRTDLDSRSRDLLLSFTGTRSIPQGIPASTPRGPLGNDPDSDQFPPPPPFPQHYPGKPKTPAPMCPLMDHPNGRPVYTPWTHRDLKGLTDELPPIKDGAGKWIRTFERKTTADRLTMGDARAVLMQGAGSRAVQDVETAAGTTRQPDNYPFDPFRPVWWNSLRDLYPTQNSGACMSGLRRKRGETAGEYLTRANDLWKDGFGTHPGANEATEAVFRTAVINGLSPKTRECLEAVIGLAEMRRRAWEQAVVHHVTRECNKETEDDQEDIELKKRLLRMDVKTATQQHNRDKKGGNKEQASEIMALTEAPQPSPSAPPQTNNPPQTQPQPNNPSQPQPQANNPPQTQFYPNNQPQYQPQANNPPQAQFYPNNQPQYQPQYQPQANNPPPQNQLQPAPAQPWQSAPPGPTRSYARQPRPNRSGPFRSGPKQNPQADPCYYCNQVGHWANKCPQRGPPLHQDNRMNNPTGNGWSGPQNPGAPMYPTWADNGRNDGPYQY